MNGGEITNSSDNPMASMEMSSSSSSSSSSGNLSRVKNYMNTGLDVVRNRQWRKTLRSPDEFFGLSSDGGSGGGGENWNVPRGSELGGRFTNNAGYFATNYALFSSVLMVYEIVSDWSLLFWVVGTAGVWVGVTKSATQFPIQLGSMKINKRSMYFAMVLLTLLILTIYVGPTFLFVLGCTTVLGGGHAVFRNPVSYKRLPTEDPAASGDIQLEEAGDGI